MPRFQTYGAFSRRNDHLQKVDLLTGTPPPPFFPRVCDFRGGTGRRVTRPFFHYLPVMLFFFLECSFSGVGDGGENFLALFFHVSACFCVCFLRGRADRRRVQEIL